MPGNVGLGPDETTDDARPAIVASRQGGPAITSPDVPDLLLSGECVDVCDHLAAPALSVLDRVAADGSEGWDLREEAGDPNPSTYP